MRYQIYTRFWLDAGWKNLTPETFLDTRFSTFWPPQMPSGNYIRQMIVSGKPAARRRWHLTPVRIIWPKCMRRALRVPNGERRREKPFAGFLERSCKREKRDRRDEKETDVRFSSELTLDRIAQHIHSFIQSSSPWLSKCRSPPPPRPRPRLIRPKRGRWIKPAATRAWKNHPHLNRVLREFRISGCRRWCRRFARRRTSPNWTWCSRPSTTSKAFSAICRPTTTATATAIRRRLRQNINSVLQKKPQREDSRCNSFRGKIVKKNKAPSLNTVKLRLIEPVEVETLFEE